MCNVYWILVAFRKKTLWFGKFLICAMCTEYLLFAIVFSSYLSKCAEVSKRHNVRASFHTFGTKCGINSYFNVQILVWKPHPYCCLKKNSSYKTVSSILTFSMTLKSSPNFASNINRIYLTSISPAENPFQWGREVR